MTSSSYPMTAAEASSSRQPDLGDVGAHLGRVHGRVEDVAFLTTGAAHEHGVDALGVVPGHAWRAPLDASSSGWAWTVSSTERVAHRRSRYRSRRRPGHPCRPAHRAASADRSPADRVNRRSGSPELGACIGPCSRHPAGRAVAPARVAGAGGGRREYLQAVSDIFRAKANKLLDRVEDPRDTLDLSYEKQLENLQKLRRSVAEVATARKRIEIQATSSSSRPPSSSHQARDALTQKREDLAREALSRRSAIAAELTDLETQHSQVARAAGAARRDHAQAPGPGLRLPYPQGDAQGHLHSGRGPDPGR